MTVEILPGAEPWSHVATATDAPGALVVHGFTGNPSSMRGLAEAFAAAGYHVEMPRLPGHGTTLDDMSTTSWPDWYGEADAALARLRARSTKVVVAGLSMGGTITLRLGAAHPEIAALICINPATQPLAEMLPMVEQMIADGSSVMPGIGSDIADPDAHESAYEGTPLAQLVSLSNDGLSPLTELLPATTLPLLLFSSPQDHVVDPAQGDHLAAAWGGPIERVVLERSYHVATQDYDKGLIEERSVAFADQHAR